MESHIHARPYSPASLLGTDFPMAGYAQNPQHYYQTRPFQYPSPTSENFTDSAIGSEEVMIDPKSHLRTRWNEMQKRITCSSLADETVTAIHKSLDHITDLLSFDRTGTETEGISTDIGLGISGVEIADSDYTAEATTPTASDAPEAICRPQSEGETLAQSQALLIRVQHAVEQLRLREEEYRHLHNVAIMKPEAGGQRILQLQSEVNELETESAKDQSELTFLKLSLRMLEIQAEPYIPKDDRDGLREGIRRWKLDWADVDHRRRARRKKTQVG